MTFPHPLKLSLASGSAPYLVLLLSPFNQPIDVHRLKNVVEEYAVEQMHLGK